MKRYMWLLVPLLMLDVQASRGTVFFYDNFNDGPIGNIVTPLNWDVFNGTVDIGDPKDAWWGASEHATLDLEGSLPSEAGALITTKQEFTLAPGTYELSFKAAGSSYEDFSPSDTFSYGLTDIFTGTETYEWDRTAQFVYYRFNLTKSTQTRIFFDQDDATDYYGIQIDEIKLVRIIPEPTNFILALVGSMGVGCYRRTKATLEKKKGQYYFS